MTDHKKLIKQITYHDNWDFTLLADGAMVRIRVTVQDADNLDQMTRMTMHTKTDPKSSDREFLKCIYDAIRRMEEHETGEFFRLNGEAPFNPHEKTLPVSVANEYMAIAVSHLKKTKVL
jgi:hypothetical protein